MSSDQRRARDRVSGLTAESMAPAVLIAVAAIQMVMVYRSDLTPWKGGGFGMFSTTDMPASRFLKVYLVTEQGRQPAALPEALRPDVSRVEAAPSVAVLQPLALRLAELTWVRPRSPRDGVDAVSPPPAQALAPGAPLPPETVRIPFDRVEAELWRYTFSGADDRLSAREALAATARRDAARERID